MFVCVCSQNPRTHGRGSVFEPKTARRRRVCENIHTVRPPFALTHSLTHVYTTITYNNVRVKIRPFVYRTITLGVVGVPSREPRTVRVDPEVWSAFTEQVVEWEGQKHGEIGRHVENALSEYIDRGREARIESKLDEVLAHVSDSDSTHTHKQTNTSETVTKAREIAERLHNNHGEIVKATDVKRAIEDIAGGDERTLSKYEGMLRERRLLFEHPNDSVWTADADRFAMWAESYVDAMPSVELYEVLEKYDMTVEEHEELIEA